MFSLLALLQTAWFAVTLIPGRACELSVVTDVLLGAQVGTWPSNGLKAVRDARRNDCTYFTIAVGRQWSSCGPLGNEWTCEGSCGCGLSSVDEVWS